MSEFRSLYEKFKECENTFKYVEGMKFIALRFDMAKSSKKLKNLKIMAGERIFYEAMMDAAKHLYKHKSVRTVFVFNDELNVIWEVKKEFCLQKVISKLASDITVYFNKSMSSVTERKEDAYIFDGRVVCGGDKKLMDGYLSTRQTLAYYAGMTRCIEIKKIPIELISEDSKRWLEETVASKYPHKYNAMSDYDKRGMIFESQKK